MIQQRTWLVSWSFLVVVFSAAVCLSQDSPDPTPGKTSPEAESQRASDGVETKQASDDPPSVSVDDVLGEFQNDRPRAQPVLPRDRQDELILGGDQQDKKHGKSRVRHPDGFFLVDRTGRLTQDGGWWIFNFVSDNNPDQIPDPPMKLLPNQMLERMVRESEGAARTVDFIVSGEVTDFMGENYLLLRKLMRKRDSGNLTN